MSSADSPLINARYHLPRVRLRRKELPVMHDQSGVQL